MLTYYRTRSASRLQAYPTLHICDPSCEMPITIVYFHNEIRLLSMLDVQDVGCAGHGRGSGFVCRGMAMNTQNDATPSSWYAIEPTQLDCDLTT